MTIRLVRENMRVVAKGRPVSSNVGLFFGILLLIVGVSVTIAVPFVGAIIIFISWLMLWRINVHTRNEQRKFLNRLGYTV